MPKIGYNARQNIRRRNGRQMTEKISKINYSRTTNHENRATSNEISPQHIVMPDLPSGIQEKIAMAKPFHIGSSMLKVERSTFTFPLFPSSETHSTNSNVRKINFLCKTNPILTFENEAQLKELKGLIMISKNQMLRKQTQTKPKQTQLQKGQKC